MLTANRTALRTLLLVLVAVAAAVVLTRLDGGSAPSTGPALAPGTPTSQAPTGSASGDIDPASGLVWVAVADLPGDAQGVLELIEVGGPFACDKDGSTFGNYEGILPGRERGYYAEYTVILDCSGNRGARRIVAGDDGERYYTDDHYESFERVLVDDR